MHFLFFLSYKSNPSVYTKKKKKVTDTSVTIRIGSYSLKDPDNMVLSLVDTENTESNNIY